MSMPMPMPASAMARDSLDCHPNIGREAVVGSLLPVEGGCVPVPQTPGLGAVPDIGALEPFQTWSGHTA